MKIEGQTGWQAGSAGWFQVSAAPVTPMAIAGQQREANKPTMRAMSVARRRESFIEKGFRLGAGVEPMLPSV